MAGKLQHSQVIARGAGTTVLELRPDPLPSGFGVTGRWEAYATNVEPADVIGATRLTFLEDLAGSADMVPNAMGSTGAIGPSYQVVAGTQVGLGFGSPARLMTPLARSQPHTLVALIRPKSDPYDAISSFLGAATTAGIRGSVYIDGNGRWVMNAGSSLINTAPVKGAQWQIVTAVFNGANSVLRVDGAETTGNAGTDVADRLILGSFAELGGPMTAFMSAVYYAPSAWNASQRAEFEAWVRRTNRLT